MCCNHPCYDQLLAAKPNFPASQKFIKFYHKEKKLKKQDSDSKNVFTAVGQAEKQQQIVT